MPYSAGILYRTPKSKISTKKKLWIDFEEILSAICPIKSICMHAHGEVIKGDRMDHRDRGDILEGVSATITAVYYGLGRGGMRKKSNEMAAS